MQLGKIISEIITINYGRKYFERAMIFRPHNVYGPDMGYEHVIPELITKIINLKTSQGKNITLTIQADGN